MRTKAFVALGLILSSVLSFADNRPEISWSIMHPVAIDVGYMKRVIAKAAEYGNVDSFELCGLEQIGINALSLFEKYPHAAAKVDRAFVEKTRADMNAVCALAHEAGKPVYFWHRENLVPKGIFEDVPELLDADGEFDLLGKAYCDYLRYKIDDVFRNCPGLDGLVLTLTESEYSVLHNSNQRRYPAVEVVRNLVGIFTEELGRRGKRFILRSFGDGDDHTKIIDGAIAASRDAGVVFEIETKVTEADFVPWLPKNKYLRRDRPLALGAECDALGEFLGAGHLPAAQVHRIKEYVDSAREEGAARYAIRIDRKGFSIFDSAHEVNLFAYMRFIRDPAATADGVIAEYAAKRFGAAAKDLEPVLKSELELVRNINYVCSNLTFHAFPITRDFKFVKAGGIFSLYRENEPLADMEPIWSILSWMHAPTHARILAEKDLGVRLAQEGLAAIERAKDALPPDEYARQHRAFANAVTLSQALRGYTRCVVAYFEDMKEGLAEPRRLAAASAEATKTIGGLMGGPLDGPYLDGLGFFCRELLREYRIERAMRLKLERPDVCDFVLPGCITDDGRVIRLMHAAYPETKDDRIVRYAGNNRFPIGRITVKLRAPESARIEVVLDPDGTQECDIRKSWAGGIWTVSVGKKGANYPGVLSIAALRGSAVATTGAPQWPEVTREAKPWAYNWWMASAVDREGLEAQCAAMEAAGMGGFHVIPIYGAKGYEAKYRRYLSPEWMQAFKDAVEIGAKHGLGVDMTMGNGWCFGGPQLKPEQGCWKLEKTPDGQPPYVTWSLTGQKVKRAGPGGKGPMMDPYSTEAIEDFLAPYSVFDDPGAAKPLHVYHDSWEYFRAGWSPALFDAFKTKRGYDLRDHLKELAGIGEREEVGRIRCDYRETLSDLVIDDVFPKWVDWAHRRGIEVRNEAHGTCANWLDFYALADCPETEMFAAECRDILVSKFASSAAHVTGKRFVTSESCTWLAEHFTETLADFKVFIDRLLLSGVNHMFYHGCCYSPVGAVWPGWCFYASCEMNPRNPVWRDAKYLNAYITRVQSMFQSCEPDNDTLVYWPLRDYWWEADGFERMMSVHNATNWFHAQPIGAVARKLYAEGSAFDYVSDRQLQRLDLGRYAKIVVPPCRHMPEATKAAIARFTERPVRIEPFAAAGLAYSRYRRGDETVYFIVNTNATRFAATLTPTAKGAKWWMDPMTGEVRPTDDRIELEPYESGFLVCGDGALAVVQHQDASATAGAPSPLLIEGPWTLTPVCGGPELPPPRTMERLTTWSRNADGSENPFSGTMRYTTTFEWNGGMSGEAVLDLGNVSQSARVRINGRDVGFAIMAPYRVKFPASFLKEGTNTLEVEVTSTGANRIRWNDQNGIRWKYFTDANLLSYGYKGALDASKWPLCEYGLFGPVKLFFGCYRIEN